MDENTIIVKPNDQFVNNPKLEQVFSSIEKQLVAQTGFLKSMQGDISNQFKFNRDMVKKTEGEKRRESVAGEDGSNALESSTSSSKKDKKDENASPEILGLGIGGLLGSAMGGVGLAALLGGALRKTLPAILAPVIGTFVNGAVTKALTDAGATEETAKLIGNAADTGVTWGIWGSLLFGKWGGVVGLLAGIGSHLGTIMDANQDNIISGALLGINDNPEFWNKWGIVLVPAISGLLMLLGKRMGIKLLAMGGAGIAAAMAKIKKPKIGLDPTDALPKATPKPSWWSKFTSSKVEPPAVIPTPKPVISQFGTIGEETARRRAAQEAMRTTVPSGTKVGITGKVADAASNVMKKLDPIAGEALSKSFLKHGAKLGLKAIPIVGIGVGIFETGRRTLEGDFGGALREAGGIFLPSVTGLPVDASLVATDIYKDMYGTTFEGDLIRDPADANAKLAQIADYIKAKMSAEESGVAPGNVESRPEKNMFGGDIGQRRWDKKYGDTHNADGTVKSPSAPAIDPIIPMSQKVDQIDEMQLLSVGGGAGGGVNMNQMGGNVSNSTNVGGSSTTYNVFQASGSNALSNSLPVNMATA